METIPVTEKLTIYLPDEHGLSAGSTAPEPLVKAVQAVLSLDGCVAASWGTVKEDSTSALLFVSWDNIKALQHFKQDSSYKAFIKDISSFTMGQPKSTIFAPRPFPPVAALTAPSSPVTEVFESFFDKNTTQATKDKFESNVGLFIESMRTHAKGYTAFAGGWSTELVPIPGRDGQTGYAYVASIGWESVEAHLENRKTEVFQSTASLIRGHEGQLAAALVHYYGASIAKASS